MRPRPVPPAAPELPGGLLMPSAPAEAAEAAAGGDLDVRRDVCGAAPAPQDDEGAVAGGALDVRRDVGGAAAAPQTAEEAVATARAYAESISDGVIERDRAGK